MNGTLCNEASCVFPLSVAIDAQGRLEIVWEDGVTQRLDVARLRRQCPCARCRESRQAAAVESNPLRQLPAHENPDVRIVAMQPTGRYAYNIHFSDNHSSGIFTLEFLRSLGDSQ
jgi:DUF971 family protein